MDINVLSVLRFFYFIQKKGKILYLDFSQILGNDNRVDRDCDCPTSIPFLDNTSWHPFLSSIIHHDRCRQPVRRSRTNYMLNLSDMLQDRNDMQFVGWSPLLCWTTTASMKCLQDHQKIFPMEKQDHFLAPSFTEEMSLRFLVIKKWAHSAMVNVAIKLQIVNPWLANDPETHSKRKRQVTDTSETLRGICTITWSGHETPASFVQPWWMTNHCSYGSVQALTTLQQVAFYSVYPLHTQHGGDLIQESPNVPTAQAQAPPTPQIIWPLVEVLQYPLE